MQIIFIDYLSFLAKTLTFIFAFAVIALILVSSRGKGQRKEGELKTTSLNAFYEKLHKTIDHAFMSKSKLKASQKAEKAEKKTKQIDAENDTKQKVYVLDFDGDAAATAVDCLRHEVTALLSNAKPTDEVVLRLESPGGMVHSYGLASSQLVRIREAGIPLTICVDKVAASGGYMMACIANKIISAPFAILGSIGVVAEMPNINRLLKKHDVDIELITAGQYKRTLTLMGENTEDGRKKFQDEVDVVHGLFKTFVSNYRPILDIDAVSTGEAWYGSAAVDNKLADQLMTSDEYLAKKSITSSLMLIRFEKPKAGGLKARLGLAAASVLESTLVSVWSRTMKYRGY